MPTVTVSPKFQIVIPLEVREALALRPGEKLQVFQYDNRIELVPVRPIQEMRGFLRGIDTTVDRDPDRL
ncbi:MAG TPA: AbrB/MazE/SpoVT family DNA-binding domain-containing protein [Thermoanaerobaculia bacterium]|jgi:AbrB family looped-hinge helix DNA binding protein